MPVDRRAFLGAALAFPLAARASASPDVAIVGAGAAGIGAARAILAAGRTVTVLEAQDRAGGRAFTNRALDGMVFDEGAAYLESATRNPLTAHAQRLGLRTQAHDPDEWIYADAVRASAAVQRDYAAACDEVLEILERSRAASGAQALAPFLRSNPLGRTAAMSMVVADDGVDLEDLCLADWGKREGGSPYRAVDGGMGTFVQALAKGLPVSTGTAVSHVRGTASGFALETNRGTIAAKAVIVTVSPAVLASGAIRFTPDLPQGIRSAAADLQMGHLEKVAFSFATPKALPDTEFLLMPTLQDGRNRYLHIRPHGQPMAIHYAAGRYAKALVAAGAEAAIDAAKETVRDYLGTAAAAQIKMARATSWGTNPNFLGAYAAAHPARCGAREALTKPFSEKLVLAGEALAGARHQALDGAWASGERAANTVLAGLK
jgi:monoamine oxidase